MAAPLGVDVSWRSLEPTRVQAAVLPPSAALDGGTVLVVEEAAAGRQLPTALGEAGDVVDGSPSPSTLAGPDHDSHPHDDGHGSHHDAPRHPFQVVEEESGQDHREDRRRVDERRHGRDLTGGEGRP